MPDSWTVERLKRKHPSVPYNPDIATTFFRAGLIEAWGRGTIKIINECRKANLPEPEFSYDLSGFMVEFERRTVGETVAETVAETVRETVREIIRGTPAQIIKQMQSNPGITREELSKVLGLSIRGIEYHLKKLREANIIERMGSTKKGYWRVNI